MTYFPNLIYCQIIRYKDLLENEHRRQILRKQKITFLREEIDRLTKLL